MLSSRQRGGRWERLAESFLQTKGLRTLKRNFQVRSGEIDLVMMDGSTLVFAEVRYRADSRHGSGAESVTHGKQLRITSAARQFLRKSPWYCDRPCRFDVVSIDRELGEIRINWIRNAFDAA